MRAIVAAVESAGVVFAVCHVLRYAPYTRLLKRLLDDGADRRDRLASTTWSRSASGTTPTPSCAATGGARTRRRRCCSPSRCHDLDWLSSRDRPAVRSGVARSAPDPLPAARAAGGRGATAASTARSRRTARTPRRGSTWACAAQRRHGWPVERGHRRPDRRRSVTRGARDGPYGRCVYACDNDVVDHQVVSLEFDGGITATLHHDRVHPRMRDRRDAHLRHPRRLRGDGTALEVYDFLTRETTRHEVGDVHGKHGGGDDAIMDDFIAAVAAGDPALVPPRPGSRSTRTGSRSRPRPRATRTASSPSPRPGPSSSRTAGVPMRPP